MPQITIWKKNSLRFINGINQIILDYLQYREAIKIWNFIKCKEPLMPIIKSQEELFDYMTLRSNVEAYIPHTVEELHDHYMWDVMEQIFIKLDDVKVSAPNMCPDLIYFFYNTIVKDLNFSALWLQCGKCDKYNNLKFGRIRTGNLYLNVYSIKYIVGEYKLHNKTIKLFDQGRLSICNCAFKNITNTPYYEEIITLIDETSIRNLLCGIEVRTPERVRRERY